MKVCLDIQPACGPLAGIGRYTRMLAQHLPAEAGPDDALLYAWFDWRRRGPPLRIAGVRFLPIRFPGRVAMALWKTFGVPSYNRFVGLSDLYHFPNFYLPPLKSGRSVVSLHDLAFLRYPEFIESRNLRHLEQTIPRTVQRCNAIITISRFSASEISALLHVDPSRIFCTPLGVSPEFHPLSPEEKSAARSRLSLPPAFLLHVGTIEPRKNIPFLVEVFEALKDYPGHLLLAGGPGWKMEAIWDRIRRSPCRSRIRWVRNVPDTDLPSLYACADALLIPSHYEGFGLPPLEAMACGTPVFASNCGSFPEVLAGGAAALLPITDPSVWAFEILELLSSSTQRDAVIQRGLAHAARFRWEETARLTWLAYRTIATT